MARTATVTLGGREYAVEQQPFKAASAWRRRLESELAPLTALAQNYRAIEINNVGDLVGLVEQVGPLLLHAPETVAELLFAYSPGLAAQREAIEAAAFDDELVAALKEVVGLAYPFAAWSNLLRPAGPTSG